MLCYLTVNRWSGLRKFSCWLTWCKHPGRGHLNDTPIGPPYPLLAPHFTFHQTCYDGQLVSLSTRSVIYYNSPPLRGLLTAVGC